MKHLFLFLVGFEGKFDENIFLNWLKAVLNAFELLAIAGKYGFRDMVDVPEGTYDKCEYACILDAENKLKEGIDNQCILAYGGKEMPRKLFLKDALVSRDDLDQQLEVLDRYTGKLEASIDNLLSMEVDSNDQQNALEYAKKYQAILQSMAA